MGIAQVGMADLAHLEILGESVNSRASCAAFAKAAIFTAASECKSPAAVASAKSPWQSADQVHPPNRHLLGAAGRGWGSKQHEPRTLGAFPSEWEPSISILGPSQVRGARVF
jgi:hypothetical protein